MGRAPCCEKSGLKKGPWTSDEDEKLIDYIQKHGGHGSWRTLPKNAGLERCGNNCRLRWTNYLKPDIKRGRFSFQEEETIIQLHCLLGNKWSAIAARLPGRTDNEVKNYWNTHIRKRLRTGIDRVTYADAFYQSQLNVSSLVVNPQLISLASSLLSSQREKQILLLQNLLRPYQPDQLQSSSILLPTHCNLNQIQPNAWLNSYVSIPTYQGSNQLSIDNNIRPKYTHQENNSVQISPALPTPSCSTHISTEDDRESYCSSMFLNMDIPDDFFNMPDFML